MNMPRVRQDVPLPDTLGARIHCQRKAIGLTVGQLAKLLGVNRNTITNYESGKTEPSANDVLRLADALGCDIMELLPGTPRANVPRFAFRAHSALRKDVHVIASARKYFRTYTDIEDILGAKLALRLPHYPIDATDPHLERRIEGIANKVRKICGVRDCGPDNIVSVLENLGVRCLFFRYEGEGLDGLSVLQDDMSLVMLRRRNKGIERTISSAAHELGHLVMHQHLFTTEPGEVDDWRRYEREAQIFAGHFLVPTEDLLDVWEEEGLYRLAPVAPAHALLLLKRVFRVSFWFLYERVKQAELVSPNAYRRLVTDVKRLLGIRGRAKMEDLEPEPLPPDMLQRSTRFARLVRSAFIQDKIGVAKVAEMFQVPVDEAKEITAKWMAPEHDVVG
jgi:Zn-dependent peptidase ImmA (M78 family)/DNA-binding XRE family transcriptional regulator